MAPTYVDRVPPENAAPSPKHRFNATERLLRIRFSGAIRCPPGSLRR